MRLQNLAFSGSKLYCLLSDIILYFLFVAANCLIILMFYKQYRLLKVNTLLTVKSVTLSGQLWQAFTYDVPHYLVLNRQNPISLMLDFYLFHKFNTFTFYTPYFLSFDQLQNKCKRRFSIRFQNQCIRRVYFQYPIYIFSTNS